MKSKISLFLLLLSTILNAQTNHTPIISPDFPDTVITKQGVTPKDSIFALQLADFGSDPDGDSLIWSISTNDSVATFFSAKQDTLFVHSRSKWFGRGHFVVQLTDMSGAFETKEIAVVAFNKDGKLPSADGTKTEYYIPWHPQLDFNRIASVEQFLIEEGYQEEALDREIHWSRWKRMEKLKDAEFTRGWMNEYIFDTWSWNSQKMFIDYTLDELLYNNVNCIRVRNSIFMENINSNEIIQIFDPSSSNVTSGIDVSKRDFEIRYLINQAHNKGMKVLMGPFLSDIDFGRWDIVPDDWDAC